MYVSSVTFFIRFWQSVHPSELSIMGPLGSCGIPALWSHLRSRREWGLLGRRKISLLIYYIPLECRRYLNGNWRCIMQTGPPLKDTEKLLPQVNRRKVLSVCVNLTLQFSLLDVWMQCFPLARGEIWSSTWTTPFCFWKSIRHYLFWMEDCRSQRTQG